MKRLIATSLLIGICAPSLAFAKIDLTGTLTPPSGANLALPEDPADLLDKAVNALPQSEEELKAVGSKLKNSFSTQTGQQVRGVLKDIGKAFVWATELMVKGIKYLIDKL